MGGQAVNTTLAALNIPTHQYIYYNFRGEGWNLAATVIPNVIYWVMYQSCCFHFHTTGGNTSVTDGLFKLNPFQQQAAFYDNANTNNPIKGQGETYFYSQANFEPSPLNRVTETFAPGNSWVGTSGNATESARKSVKLKYFSSTVGVLSKSECRRLVS